ncbi:MAG: ABC transporter ATP-binding protein [Kiloniellales bacterium]|nr:ABC transporter ATP-binding protein [Kiloniellales bacterium]
MSLLAVEDLRAGYGRIQILDGIDLAVGEVEYVGILGHNGMGKTTLLKALMGVIPASGGRITLDGEDITRAPMEQRARGRIGYVPQGREIFPALSVRENLRLGAWLRGLDTAGENNAIEAVLADFPLLAPLLERPGGALSGGEQQLLALARCLIGDPRLILLDEPTEGIQPSIIEEIVERLRQLKARASLSVILVEQNLDFIKALADRVLIIQRGRITHTLEPDTLSDPELVGEFIGMRA